jgi:hypothetical protein
MFPVISSVVFFSVNFSLITVGFGSSEQFFSRDISFRHNDRGGGRWKREKEGEETGIYALLVKLRA